MPRSMPSPTPRELLLDALGGYVKKHSGVDSNPLDVDLEDPLPNQARFYLFETSYSDDDHGWAINVRLDNTDENGYEITDRESGSDWNPDGEYQVILGGYNENYDMFTFWDDAVYSHYDTGDDNDPHKSYVSDETLTRASDNGMSIQPRSLRARGERGGETVITVTPDRIDEALQMRDRIEWIRTQLNEELEDDWAENQYRAQRLEHLVYEFLANTDRRKSAQDRREQAFSRVHELQDISEEAIKNSLRADVYGEHESGTLPESLNSLLPQIERRYFESYNLWKEPVVFEDVDGTPDDIDLYFPPDEERSQTVIEQIDIALRSGNHVILTGPPGSGKSDLAEQVAEYYAHNYQMATATDDWTTFDTIGGYRPQSDGDLEFHPGLFLQRFMDESRLGTRGIEAKNEWLVIDELNRANIDKAFGSLFSALTGNNVTLPFDDTTQEPTKPIKLNGNPNAITEPRVNSHTYYIPEDWRLIATINSVDKSSLYRMSRAFMRRFAFIPIPTPTAKDLNKNGKGLLEEYLNVWEVECPDSSNVDNIDDETEVQERLKTDLSNFWYAVQQYQKVGPGVIKDVLEQTLTGIEQTGELHYEYAVVAKLLPQLDGLPPSRMEDVLTMMDTRGSDWFDPDIAEEFTREYLDIKIESDGE
ncbi:AAA family ATPase [Halogeometricum sp. S1BR25-6]|uniref:AAA family ATPase n=1 Tax=Halogeometricum salsisoli TaxID=2950536 RepID=A0ABU2GLK9_9EURY|nr:AAA family ATPase [Halogeometricum sp. S1BR25-6]MDS0300938.1 AAA family ATPase [Halogeometricum sp. S1BR25-6]